MRRACLCASALGRAYRREGVRVCLREGERVLVCLCDRLQTLVCLREGLRVQVCLCEWGRGRERGHQQEVGVCVPAQPLVCLCDQWRVLV